MSCEIELKYRIIEEMDVQSLFNHPFFSSYLMNNKRLIHMESTYYDTVNGELSKEKVCLRQRLENGQSVITLKIAKCDNGALSERFEWEVCAPSVKKALPQLLLLGAPKDVISCISSSELIVCANFSFSRSTANIIVSNSLTIALCYDIGYLSRDGKRKTPLREVEFEMISGTSEELLCFGNRFMRYFGAVEETRSKLSRALES